jgi:hypothetical protein
LFVLLTWSILDHNTTIHNTTYNTASHQQPTPQRHQPSTTTKTERRGKPQADLVAVTGEELQEENVI